MGRRLLRKNNNDRGTYQTRSRWVALEIWGRFFTQADKLFEGKCPLYILGLNPGGCPQKKAHEKTQDDIEDAIAEHTS